MKNSIKKLGKVQTLNERGEVVAEKDNAIMLLPPHPDLCQACASDHPWDQPHNQQSLHWQYHFYSERGRWPTWTDAMAHCTDEIKAHWRRELPELMRANGLEVPADLMEQKPAGR